MSSRFARLLTAVVLGAAGGTVVLAGSAYAAACPSGTGVTVVVNSSVSCDRNGGGSAASNFRDAGHSLTMASRQPGFVCRVGGIDRCGPIGRGAIGQSAVGIGAPAPHTAARSQAQTQTQAGDQTDCERLCPCRCQRLAETETETETVRVREAERLRVGQRICSV